MQSRLLRVPSTTAPSLQARANIEGDTRPGTVEYTARLPYAVLTTADMQSALDFCGRAGGELPEVLQMVDGLDHAAACERWL